MDNQPHVASTTIDFESFNEFDFQFEPFNPPPTLPTSSATVTSSSKVYREPIEELPSVEDVDVGKSPFNDQESNSQKHATPTGSLLELGFLEKYFDVTTEDVVTRLISSMVPRPGQGSFIEKKIKSNPDLYGPLWINVTLIFSIAICGNIASYLSSQGLDSWHYDFAKVGLAASTVSTYIFAVPIALYIFFWFRGCTFMFSLVETICAYGYSMTVFLPISILWVVSPRIVQLVLVIVGGVTSGGVLSLGFTPVVTSDPGQTVKFSYIIFLVIMGLHALVAFSFLTYFF